MAVSVAGLRHLEWFDDYVRIEQALFEGAPRVEKGVVRPDLSALGHAHGLEFKAADVLRYRIQGVLG